MISHELRCIFIHIPKTAGTSIEQKLGHFETLERGVQDHRTLREIQPVGAGDVLGSGGIRRAARLLRTMARRRLKGRGGLTREQYRGYYKFSVVRNPWSRAYSWYENVMKDESHQRALGVGPDCGFAEFLDGGAGRWALRPQMDWLVDHSGGLPYDLICRFERIAEDFARVCAALGIADATLPWLAVGSGGDYRRAYDDRSRALIAEACAEEIAMFGYRFGE